VDDDVSVPDDGELSTIATLPLVSGDIQQAADEGSGTVVVAEGLDE